jgi:hypothetical protein
LRALIDIVLPVLRDLIHLLFRSRAEIVAENLFLRRHHRLLNVADGQVTFRWKDYAHANKQRKMTVSGEEFLRRFLLHVLPKGFIRIRFFGCLARPGDERSCCRCASNFSPINGNHLHQLRMRHCHLARGIVRVAVTP